MSTTFSLPYTRFVAQTSNGSTRSKSSYLSMMAENEIALSFCKWREAECPTNEVALPVNNVFLTDGYLDDRYDAYIRGGKANADGVDTFEGYAGMVAYRFKLPGDYVSGLAHLQTFVINASRDRFLRAGVRVVAVISGNPEPSDDWAIVRGENSVYKTQSSAPEAITAGLRSYGALNQAHTTFIVDTRAADATIAIDLEGIDTGAKAQYLYIYLTLEDYQNRWIWHSQDTRREYWIEGAAMLVGASNAVSFDAQVLPDDEGDMSVCAIEGESPTFIQPQHFAFVQPGIPLKAMPGEGNKVPTDFSADLKGVGGDVLMFGAMEAVADMSYQVMGANLQDGNRTMQDVFRSLVAMSRRIGGIATNYAFNGRAIPLDEAERLTIVPRFDRCADFTDIENMSIPQPGLSILFVKSDATDIEYATVSKITVDAESGNETSALTDVKCVTSPSFLQVSAMAVVVAKMGRKMVISTAAGVENTGLSFRIVVYKLSDGVAMGRLGFCAIPALLLTKGVARCMERGKTGEVESEENGNFSATVCGVSGIISGALVANDGITINLDSIVNEGDVLVLLPVPIAVNPAAAGNMCYFGRQANPETEIHDYSWARHSENLGWFPRITIT